MSYKSFEHTVTQSFCKQKNGATSRKLFSKLPIKRDDEAGNRWRSISEDRTRLPNGAARRILSRYGKEF